MTVGQEAREHLASLAPSLAPRLTPEQRLSLLADAYDAVARDLLRVVRQPTTSERSRDHLAHAINTLYAHNPRRPVEAIERAREWDHDPVTDPDEDYF